MMMLHDHPDNASPSSMTGGPLLSDVIEWDVPNWSVALRYWRTHTRQCLPNARALEIGARHGGLSLWSAMNGMHVLCTDIEGPSSEAVEKHRRYGVGERVTYAPLDAMAIPYTNQFDVVMFKSVLGGIGRLDHKEHQQSAILGMYRSLRDGGELWFAENLRASPCHQYLRKRYVDWGERWRYVSIPEMKEFLSVFSSVQYTTVGFLGTFGRSARQRTVLGTLDRLGADRLVAESWRYILIGIANK